LGKGWIKRNWKELYLTLNDLNDRIDKDRKKWKFNLFEKFTYKGYEIVLN
jgi:hypothetical protein